MALFDWLADEAPGTGLAWDVATGNGQAALALADRFTRVVASDASAEQIAEAPPHDRIEWRVEPAETGGPAEGTADLVTVAQALHWLDVPAFWRNARRALTPGGVVAAWCYQLARINPSVDAVVEYLYRGVLGADWPLGRRQVELGYGDIDFPFEAIEAPVFEMRADWSLARFSQYLSTWSAARRYTARTGLDPVAAVHSKLEEAWGDRDLVRTVSWPLDLRVGRATS